MRPPAFIRSGNFLPRDGQLYRTVQEMSNSRPYSLKQVTYNPYSNSCTELPAREEGRYLRKTFVSNGDEMYALLSEPCVENHLRTQTDQTCGNRKHSSFLTKYKLETNSWEDVTSFDHLNLRDGFCMVANDNFIYFIGGRDWCGGTTTALTDVDKFELSRKQWDKAADTKMAKSWARGAAVKEKIYISQLRSLRWQEFVFCFEWEVYDETTNEWQIITGVREGHGYTFAHILAADGELYRVDTTPSDVRGNGGFLKRIRIERYHPEENKWETKTDVTARRWKACSYEPRIVCCSMRIFKGLFNMRQAEAFPFDVATTTQPSLTSQRRVRKCLIMFYLFFLVCFFVFCVFF